MTATTIDLVAIRTDATVYAATFRTLIGISTGSVDNRILRADGTGGATLQAGADATIDDSGNLACGTITASGTVTGPTFTASGTSQTTLGNATGGVLLPGPITAATSATKAAIIKGAASQTANLTEWQDSAGSVLTSVTAAGNVGVGTAAPSGKLNISGTSSTVGLRVGGTHAANDVAINVAPTAITGAYYAMLIQVSASTSLYHTLHNTNNSAAGAHVYHAIKSGGSGGGDAVLQLDVPGVLTWSMGVDNSDSDKLKISKAANPGTFDVLTFSTDGSAAFSYPVRHGLYTFATVPTASSYTNYQITISDRAARSAYSDGTNWRFCADDVIIS